jgi:TPR repeat protein
MLTVWGGRIMKNLVAFIFFIFFSLNSLAFDGSHVDDGLQLIAEAIGDRDWRKSMELLLARQEESADINLLWGIWYDGIDNPSRDPIKSKKSLEISQELGSREAQLLLVAKYLHTKDINITDYKKGFELASDLAGFYKEKIDLGQDADGEFHRILGQFYLFGMGVDKDVDYGFKLLRKASELGDSEAKEIVLQNH